MTRFSWAWTFVFVLAFASQVSGEQIVFDFESGKLAPFEVVEGSFPKPLGDKVKAYNTPSQEYPKQGKYYLTTLDQPSGKPTDRPTGVIESPIFTIEGDKATLMVSGGRHDETRVALCTLDGKEVRTARGKNNESMVDITWNVADLKGQKVLLRVIDQHTGGWGHIRLDDFRVEGTIDEAATAKWRTDVKGRKHRAILATMGADIAKLRAAIEDLTLRYEEHYPNGEKFLARLDAIVNSAKDDSTAAADIADAFAELQVDALTAHPALVSVPLLYVTHEQYRSDHHNTATMFQTGEINTGSFVGGGAMKTVHFGDDARVETLVSTPEGIVRDPCIEFDGERILVSLRNDIKDDYHLYEYDLASGDLKQLTVGSGISDIDPIYMPDGTIMFTSTREPKFCMCNRHIMGNLFTMNADGSNIQQIGHSTLHEGHAALMPDGRVMYDRWEYVDRNFGDAQGVWVTNPDGTNHAIYWGNNTNSPGGVLDPRIVPGEDRLMICTFSSCHDRPWGAIALVDRRKGIDGKPPVVQTWPADAIDLVEVGNYDTFKRVKQKYEDPYPLDDTYFLASGQIEGERTGIWLLDRHGNEVLIHEDGAGCFDPMPLAARERPTAIPSRINLADENGYCFVSDVYIGHGMDAVPRGSVKSLRIVESPEKRFWTQTNWNGNGTQAPGMAWNDFNNKRIIGTVPVEEDGSAYFAVPADKFVYLQLLDEKGRMIQSMRSGMIVRPGEQIGCVGCHEDRLTSIASVPPSVMTYRKPSIPEPWYGEPRLFSYMDEVQPVFDAHCVECHDYGKKAGDILNLSGDRGLCFNTSYTELRSKGYAKVVGAGPFRVQNPTTWGSYASELASVILKGHGDPETDAKLDLSQEDRDRVITWIDINAPYYPEYASAYRSNLYGRSPLDMGQINRLSQLTGVDLKKQPNAQQVLFGRPELSPCLAKFESKDDPNYIEALAIITTGKEVLEARPRADMAEFELVDPLEIEQEAKYQQRLAVEEAMRAAIRDGELCFEQKLNATE